LLGGGNSQCVIVRQRTSDKSSAAKLEENLNRCRKKNQTLIFRKCVGGGVLGYKIRKVKRCTLGKERKAEEIAGIEKRKGREK